MTPENWEVYHHESEIRAVLEQDTIYTQKPKLTVSVNSITELLGGTSNFCANFAIGM
jgi:hypothetical protein